MTFLTLVIVAIIAFVAYGLISKDPRTLEKVAWRLILALLVIVPIWVITYRLLVMGCMAQEENACKWMCWIGFC